MRYPLPWFLLSDDPKRYIRRTTVNCRLYRSSHAGSRFGRSGSSGFVVGFRRLRWCGFDRWNRTVFCRFARDGRSVGKYRSRNRLRKTATVRRRVRRFGRGRLKTETACRPTSGFEVSCELRLAIVISNDAEQLSFKKGTMFVRKTMIY